MAVSELPGNPNAVWTVRRHVEGKKKHIQHEWAKSPKSCVVCHIYFCKHAMSVTSSTGSGVDNLYRA